MNALRESPYYDLDALHSFAHKEVAAAEEALIMDREARSSKNLLNKLKKRLIMATPIQFQKVKVPGRSAFDLASLNILEGRPISLSFPNMMPGRRVGFLLLLPPRPSCDLKVVVPMRLLYGGFESWLTARSFDAANSAWLRFLASVSVTLRMRLRLRMLGAGSLADAWSPVFQD